MIGPIGILRRYAAGAELPESPVVDLRRAATRW